MFSTLLVFCTAPSNGRDEAGEIVSARRPLQERLGTGLSGKLRLFGLLFGAPVDEVAGVESDAEEVGGDETELSGADADDANDGAIDTGDDPALPELLANEHGGEHGQDTGKIIESNHVQHVVHIE